MCAVMAENNFAGSEIWKKKNLKSEKINFKHRTIIIRRISSKNSNYVSLAENKTI